MYDVIGIEKVDYKNKMGRRVQGFKFHCTYINEDRIEGLGVESIYCGIDVNGVNSVVLGSTIKPLYNKYGSAASIQILGTN